jgi:hypothetical protein
MLLLIMTRPQVFLKISPLWNLAQISPTFEPSTSNGWSDLAMVPATYLLLEGTPFVGPVDPNAVAIYPQWAAPTNNQDDQCNISLQQE